MKPLVFAASVVAIAFSCSFANAQWYLPGGYGGGYGGWGSASTPQSADGMAMGNIIRSQGMYNQMTSAAMINVEQARSKFIDGNQRQWTRSLSGQAASPGRAQADLEATRGMGLRSTWSSRRITRPSLPPRLDTSQVDYRQPERSGSWPNALKRRFLCPATHRNGIIVVLAEHTGVTSELSSAITKKVREMHENLPLAARSRTSCPKTTWKHESSSIVCRWKVDTQGA